MLESKTIETALSLISRDESKVMALSIGPHASVGAKQYIPRADAQKAPTLSVKGDIVKPGDTKYIIVGLDIDAPFQSFTALGPILHWIQPGFTAAATPNESGLTELKPGSEPFAADYIGPAPPPGSGPHRYIFFLYQQPDSFDAGKFATPNGQPLALTKRIRFNLTQFEKDAKLGPLLAATYFCSN